MSPWTIAVAWISTRSPARIDPSTSPPMTASRVWTSPRTRLPRARRTCWAAWTLPRISPSTLTVPSVRTSPVITVPLAMMESPPSARRRSAREFPFGSSRSSAISVPLLHQRKWIHHLAEPADLEVQMGGARVPGVAGEPDHLARIDHLPRPHQEAREVAVHRLIILGVLQEDEGPVLRILPRLRHDRPGGGPDQCAGRDRDVQPGMGIIR